MKAWMLGALEGSSVGARLGFSPHTPCAEEQLSGRFGTGPAVPRARQPLAAIRVSRDMALPIRPMHGCPMRAEVGQRLSDLISPTSFSLIFSPPDPLI